MMAITHLSFGILFGLIFSPFFSFDSELLFFLFVMFGSIIIDIDCPNSFIGRKTPVMSTILNLFFGHRGFFHSIFFGTIVSIVSYPFIKYYSFAIFLGAMSHLFSDGLTVSGVNLLYPFSELRMAGFIKTDSLSEYVLLCLVLIIIVLIVF